MNAFTTLIHLAVEDTRFQRERPKVPVPLAERDAIIGNSAVMHGMYKQIGRLAAKSVPVLIRGETGTGKAFTLRLAPGSRERDRGGGLNG